MRALLLITGMRFLDKVTDLEVQDGAGLVSIEATLVKVQRLWTGHRCVLGTKSAVAKKASCENDQRERINSARKSRKTPASVCL